MEQTSVFWLRVAATLYAVGLLHTIQTVLRRRAQMSSTVLVTFGIAVVLHLVSVVDAARFLGHLPANNFYETVSLCALLIAVLFLFAYWRYRFEGLSVFLFPLVFIMTLVGAMQYPVASWTNRTARDALLTVHVVLILLGYAGLLMTAVASIFYLMQERQLKAKRPGAFFQRLPPLGTLDNLISRSMGFGFTLLTLGLITACVWAFIETGTRWIGDTRITFAFLTWGFCLLMVFLRVTAGWRGRKAALMAIGVLLCTVATWAAHAGLRRLLVLQ
jgi:ABC-type uncharacterized transport system permease subunit